MKNIIFVTIYILSINVFCQQSNNEKLEELKNDAIKIENEIKEKQDILKKIKKEIRRLEHEEFLNRSTTEDGEFSIKATLNRDGTLRKSSNVISDKITSLYKGDKVKLTDYKDGYWLINTGQHFGYINEMFISETKEMKVFKEQLKIKNDELNKRQEIEQEKKKKAAYKAYRKKIINKYGKSIGKKLLEGYYWIGMTAKMAIISLGKPRNINKSTGSWGVHEQWIYSDLYLYFKNGKLDSYQSSN